MTFSTRGTNIADDFMTPEMNGYQNPNFRADAYTYIKDLNMNMIRVVGATDITAGLSPNYFVNWADILENLLATADQNGCKVLWGVIGNSYPGTETDVFGVIPSVTPIPEAKAVIDKLAGANSRNHNFITDPRVWGWSVSNEDDLTNPADLDWNIQVMDYIRSKGGKAWAAAPWDSVRGYWTAPYYEQVLGSHSDMIELHYYGEWSYIRECNGHDPNITDKIKQDTLYNAIMQDFQDIFGSMPKERLYLGEYGCWLGYGTAEGLDEGITFTNQDRINVFAATLKAANDFGLQKLCQLGLFSKTVDQWNYGLVNPVSVGNSYIDDNLANLLRTAYSSPTPQTLPFHDDFANLSKWQHINGTWTAG